MVLKTTLQNYLLKRWVLLFMLLIALNKSFGQNGVAINTTGTVADNSAILDLTNSLGTKGLLLPKVASTGSVTTPATGLIVYQTNNPAGIYCNTGTSASPVWILLSSATGTVTGVTASGPLSSSGGATPNISLTGIIPIANGGTGLSALGSSNQLLQVNLAGTALQYFTPTYLTGNQTITLSGDVSGSGTTTIPTTLATVNGNVGTFNNVTVNAKGLVTAASNLSYQSALNGTGYVKQSGTTTSYIPLIPLGGGTDVTGILPIANGGTNNGTVGLAGSVFYSNGTQHASTSIGTSGQVLTSSGTGAPLWTTPTTGTITSVTASSPLTSSGGTTPNVSLTGIVSIANGGTNGNAAPLNGGIAYGTGAAYGFSTAPTAAGQVLTSTGTTGAPTWTTLSSATFGQNSYNYLGSTYTTTTNSFQVIPGLSTTLTIPSNSVVIVSTAGGTIFNSGNYSQTEVVIFIDNTSTVITQEASSFYDYYGDVIIGNWSFNSSFNIAAGSHKFEIRAIKNGGGSATISGPTTGAYSALQGYLTVTILKQ